MIASDADEASGPDDDQGSSTRRARRDVLEVGKGSDTSRRRNRDRERDLGRRDEDDGRDDDDRRYDDRRREARRDDGRRQEGRGDGGRRDDDRRDRDDRYDDGRRDRDEDRGGRDRERKRDGGRAQGGKDGDDKGGNGEKKGQGGSEKGEGDDGGKDGEAAQNRRRSRRPLIIGIAVVVALLLLAGGVYYWLSTRGKTNTDDAYTDGNTVSIAPQVSGQVMALEVNDNQFVHKGDVLIRIDSRQYQYSEEQAKGMLDANTAQIANQKLGVEISKKNFPASLQLAQANLQSAKANLALQQSNFDRQKNLPKQATTQQDVDTTASSLQQAQAQVAQEQARVVQAEPVQQNIGQSEQQVSQLQGQAEQAKGQVDQANLNIEWSVVRAPQDGWVTRRNVNAGNYVSSGTQIMSLVTTDIWITANFKETELNGMHPGQAVTIAVDAFPDLDLKGHVDSIQHGSGSRFSAFPAENATGNFVKIVQRVPVKIVIDSGLKSDEPLPLGVSVVPTVMLK